MLESPRAARWSTSANPSRALAGEANHGRQRFPFRQLEGTAAPAVGSRMDVEARGDTLTEDEQDKAHTATGCALLAVGMAFFLGELGDQTMLATSTLATDHGPVGTWLGSTPGHAARGRSPRRRLPVVGTPAAREGREVRRRSRLPRLRCPARRPGSARPAPDRLPAVGSPARRVIRAWLPRGPSENNVLGRLGKDHGATVTVVPWSDDQRAGLGRQSSRKPGDGTARPRLAQGRRRHVGRCLPAVPVRPLFVRLVPVALSVRDPPTPFVLHQSQAVSGHGLT